MILKTSLFTSLCILRDLSQQKIPRELSGGGDPPIFLSSHGPMERFFDGTDQENSKTQGGKGQIRKIQKKRRKEWRKEKEEIFPFVEVPILKCSPEGGSHEGGNLPYNLLTRCKVFKNNMVPPNLPKCRLDS